MTDTLNVTPKMLRKIDDAVLKRIPKIQKAVEADQKQVFKMMALKMIGVRSSAGAGKERVPWAKLADSTRKKKKDAGLELPNYFFFTGKLKSVFEKTSASKTLGKPTVEVKRHFAKGDLKPGFKQLKKGSNLFRGPGGHFASPSAAFKRVLTHTIYVKPYPMIRLTEGNLEEKIFFADPVTVRKLMNVGERGQSWPYRPLLGPYLSHYLRTRLAQTAKRAAGGRNYNVSL